jgi:hypothetical protein
MQLSRSHSVSESVRGIPKCKAGKLHRTMNAQLSFAVSGNHGCGVGSDSCQAENAPKVCFLLECWDRGRGSTESSVGEMLGAWEDKIDIALEAYVWDREVDFDIFHICFLSMQSLL